MISVSKFRELCFAAPEFELLLMQTSSGNMHTLSGRLFEHPQAFKGGIYHVRPEQGDLVFEDSETPPTALPPFLSPTNRPPSERLNIALLTLHNAVRLHNHEHNSRRTPIVNPRSKELATATLLLNTAITYVPAKHQALGRETVLADTARAESGDDQNRFKDGSVSRRKSDRLRDYGQINDTSALRASFRESKILEHAKLNLTDYALERLLAFWDALPQRMFPCRSVK